MRKQRKLWQRRRFKQMHSTTLSNYFESTVYPYQTKIRVCHEFLKRYFNKLKKYPYAWLIDQNENCVRVRFGQSEEQNFVTSGRDVAAAFQWNKPTRVKFEITGKFNRFKIVVVNDNNASSEEVTLKQEVIEIDSDLEDIEDYYDRRLYHFAKEVTKPWKNKKRSQMMNFPNMISINVLPDTQQTITLVNRKNQKQYQCKLITSNRGPNEKYLGEDWNKFLKDNKLRQGDKLFFNLQYPPESLFVQIVHNNTAN